MITEPTYLDVDSVEALCHDGSCLVHADGENQCPVLVAESMTIEAVRESL